MPTEAILRQPPTPPPLPAERLHARLKLEVLEHSVRCFNSGALGLIPILGIPFLCRAFHAWGVVWRKGGRDFNPAKYHALAGFAFAWLAAALNLAFVGLIIRIVSLA